MRHWPSLVNKTMTKICKKCGNIIPNRITIDGTLHSLHNRKFCLECSPFGKHNTRDLTKPLKPRKRQYKTDVCIKCGSTKKIHCKGMCSSCYTTIIRRTRIKRLKAMFGGKCSICGYSKCQQALCFHHTNPDEKEMGFGGSRSWKSLVKEASKCILVCANCHAEIHSSHQMISPRSQVQILHGAPSNDFSAIGTDTGVKYYAKVQRKSRRVQSYLCCSQ